MVLLRRLRFNYGGGLQYGSVELSGNVIKKWLMPKPTVPDAVPGSERGLAGDITNQARSIRSGAMTSDWGEPDVSSPWQTGRKAGRGMGSRGGGGRSGDGGGRGAGNTFWEGRGASDNRYSQDEDADVDHDVDGHQYPSRWVNTGWGYDEEEGESMLDELSRKIRK